MQGSLAYSAHSEWYFFKIESFLWLGLAYCRIGDEKSGGMLLRENFRGELQNLRPSLLTLHPLTVYMHPERHSRLSFHRFKVIYLQQLRLVVSQVDEVLTIW
jgi:hypothetical protein